MIEESVGALEGLMLLTLGVMVFFGVVLVLYVLFSFGMYRMAKKSGLGDEAMFAFIPVLGIYLLGRIVDEDIGGALRGKLGYIIGGSLLISLVLQPFLLVSYVAVVYALFKLFVKLEMSSVVFTLIHVLTGFMLVPFLFFWLGNKKDIIWEPVEVVDAGDIKE